ncbi:Protein CREG1 [Camponotus floridanus]|uniref:Protein CREG1 n=2 Tax=Camponotus floridanus TaxID=104421 RepID=E2AK03_CAMFO|nr:Protein CREG1 [Camponotus floridanus]
MFRIASVIAFCALLSEARNYSHRGTDIRDQDLPPADQPALVARYVVNQADYAAVATISTRKDIDTYPVANVIAYSDGLIGNGTGIPYMYITTHDHYTTIVQDLDKDNRATLLISLVLTNYCGNNLDVMNKRCPSVLLTGKFAAVNDTAEYETEAQLFSKRHPTLENRISDHSKAYLVKFDIQEIALVDFNIGTKYISMEDYFRPPVNHIVN